MSSKSKLLDFSQLVSLLVDEKRADKTVVVFCAAIVVFSLLTYVFCQLQLSYVERLSNFSYRKSLLVSSTVF